MSSTTTFISSSSSTINANVNANAAAAAAAAAANTPFITTTPIITRDMPVSFIPNNNENFNINDNQPLRSAVQSAVAKYLASRNNSSSSKTSIKLDGISFNSITANTLSELLQLNPTNLSTLPSPPPPPPPSSAPPPPPVFQPLEDLSWRTNINNATDNIPNNHYYYEEVDEQVDTEEDGMDEQMDEYCNTLNEARSQIVNKLRAKLHLMRQERKRTQVQLAKLQHLQRLRALRGKINKGTLSKLKHKQHGQQHQQQDGRKLVNGLAVLQLSSSSMSSSCTAEDTVHCHPVKKVDKCWMMSSSSPVSAEDDSLDIDDSNANADANGNGNGNGNIKNTANGNANGIIQHDVDGIIHGGNTNSIGHI